MKKLAIASALLSALAVSGAANAYQAEVGGSYNYLDPDNGSSVSKFGVDGTYYFNPVQTRNAPLAEAALQVTLTHMLTMAITAAQKTLNMA